MPTFSELLKPHSSFKLFGLYVTALLFYPQAFPVSIPQEFVSSKPFVVISSI
jgi:hypothetical protein